MKVLIIGSKGQLGSELAHILEENACQLGTIPLEYKNAQVCLTAHNDLDITDFSQVQAKVNDNFDIVFNCAAYTNVEKAEKDLDNAFKVNALGCKNLAIACEECGAKLVSVSTDYVFDGNTYKSYTEADTPSPINVYGKTKLLGEEYIRDFCTKYFIVRTSWLYGQNGNNFIQTILNLSATRSEIKVVNDQFGNPTNANDVAYHMLKLALTQDYGLYHCSNRGICARDELARKIIEFSGRNCKVVSIPTSQYPTVAQRPLFSALDNVMLRCTVGDQMRDFEDALKDFLSRRKL